MNEEIVEATSVSSESYLYQATAYEGEGDAERRNEIMGRRNDLLQRINEDDKMHIKMVEYQQECGRKTQELVRQRRRVREAEEKRLAGLAKHRQERRKEATDALTDYQKQLEQEFDEPKSKIRRRRATPAAPTTHKLQPKGESVVEGDGRTPEETDGSSKE